MQPQEFCVKLSGCIRRTYNVKSFRFKTAKNLEFKPGQYLFLTLKLQEKFVTKPLSISNSPTETGYIEFTKKITQSEFSRKLDALKAGDEILVKLPMGKFTFTGEYPKIAFLSGGIGITPIRSICKFAADRNLATNIILIYSNHTPDDIVFKDDFSAMQKDNPNLKVIHTVTSECDTGQMPCLKGYINEAMIKNNIPDYRQRRFYLCGPPGMVEFLAKILQGLNISSENIITENFTGY